MCNTKISEMYKIAPKSTKKRNIQKEHNMHQNVGNVPKLSKILICTKILEMYQKYVKCTKCIKWRKHARMWKIHKIYRNVPTFKMNRSLPKHYNILKCTKHNKNGGVL